MIYQLTRVCARACVSLDANVHKNLRFRGPPALGRTLCSLTFSSFGEEKGQNKSLFVITHQSGWISS